MPIDPKLHRQHCYRVKAPLVAKHMEDLPKNVIGNVEFDFSGARQLKHLVLRAAEIERRDVNI